MAVRTQRLRFENAVATYREVLSNSSTSAVTLTTAATTKAGDQLVCIRMTDAFTDSATLTAPTGTVGTWAQQGTDIASVDSAPRIRVWTRTVGTNGAQTVTCAATSKANHVILYVLPVGRTLTSVTTAYGTDVTPRVCPSAAVPNDSLLICVGCEYDAPDITGFDGLTQDAEIVSNASSAWSASLRVPAGTTGIHTITEGGGSAFFVVATLVAARGIAPVVVADSTTFPLLGGMLIGSPHNYDNTTYRAQIAKLDLAILGMYNGWHSGAAAASLSAIKALNPSILLGNYTIMTEMPSNSANDATAAKWSKLSSSVGPSGVGDWWAYNSAGAHTDWASGDFSSWDTNLTLQTTPDSNGDRWPQWTAKDDRSTVLQEAAWNIWYCDNNFWKPRSDADWNRNGTNDSQNDIAIRNLWRDGQRAYYDTARAQAPGLALWVNADSDLDGGVHPGEADDFTQYDGVCDGAYMEHAVGKDWSVETWGGWTQMMAWYRALKANLIGPKHILFDIYVGDAPTDYQSVRYAFASCLMDNGYFSASDDYNVIRWYDEFDLAGTATTKWLGAAIDGPQTVAWQLGVYRRNFSGGTVLVNPKGNGSRTVTVESGYSRFNGSQAPAVNSSALSATSITLADRDAIFLKKP